MCFRFFVDLLNRSYYQSSETVRLLDFFLKLGNKNAKQKKIKRLQQRKKQDHLKFIKKKISKKIGTKTKPLVKES